MHDRWWTVWGVVAGAVIVGAGAAGAEEPKASPPAAASDCRMAKFAELPVRFEGNRAYIAGEVNGRPAVFFADTGALSTQLFGTAAARYGLRANASDGVRFVGIGGERAAMVTKVASLKLGNYTARNSTFFISDSVAEDGVAGIIGRDILGQGDIEFDLAHAAIRLFKVEHCRGVNLAYWSQAPAVADLRIPPLGDRAYVIDVKLNGRRVSAEIDSGAPTSIITPGAAATAGVVPARTREKAEQVGGLGPKTVSVTTGTFDKIEVGDEAVSHAKLQIADMFRYSREAKIGTKIPTASMALPSMLLGADFMRAHRVLLAPSQGLMYFTYNGGPIFQVVGPPPGATSTDADGSHAVAPAASKP